MSRLSRALLLLSLQLTLVVPTCVVLAPVPAPKSLEEYWSDSHLQSSVLEKLLADQNCGSSERLFLACVNSVTSMAERYGLNVNQSGLTEDQSGKFSPTTSEKEKLATWLAQNGRTLSPIKVWHELNLKYVDKKSRSQVVAIGINAFLSVYKDPHTYLLPLKYYQDMAQNDSRMPQLGLMTKKTAEHLLVRKVFPGSPAETAGLKRGDRIITINGKSTEQMTSLQINEALRSIRSDRLSLTIDRDTATPHQPHYVEILNRDQIYQSVSSDVRPVAGRSIGLLTLHRFAQGTCDAAKIKIAELIDKKIKGLIIDLRDNPGGQVEEAACVTGLFFKKGTTLFETRTLDDMTENVYEATTDQLYSGPLSVMINSSTASAAEMMAGAIKDNQRGLLVGERTFGKGSFQDGRIWAQNKNIILFETKGIYYFPSGWTPQGSGIEPDLMVGDSEAPSISGEASYFSSIKPGNSRIRLVDGNSRLKKIDPNCAQVPSPQQLSQSGPDDAQWIQAKNALICQGEI